VVKIPFAKHLYAVVLTGLVLSPQALKDVSATAILSTPPPPLAAAAASAQSLGLNKLQDSVLRIGVLFTGTITFPSWYYDDASGKLQPLDDSNTLQVATYQVGTGFVVDSAGYLATNAHVVDTSPAVVTAALWDQLQQDTYNNLATERPKWTAEELTGTTNLYNSFLSKYGSWDSLGYDIVVFNPDKSDVTSGIDKLFQSGYKADVVKMGSPYPQIGKDIAIIKIEAENKFKPLVLGDSSKLTTGSTVYAIGFPAIADLGAKSFVVPTITSGIVSAIKPSEQGDYNVIQVDAKIQGGNSGGPVLDDRGKVIGIASFGAVDSDGYNWALPIDLVKGYMKELNLAGAAGGGITGILRNISPALLMVVVAALLLVTCILLGILIFHHRKISRMHTAQQMAQVSSAVAPVSTPAATPPKSKPSSLTFDSLGRVTLAVFAISALTLGASVLNSDIFARCSGLECVAATFGSFSVDTTASQSTTNSLSSGDFYAVNESIRMASLYAFSITLLLLILLKIMGVKYMKLIFRKRRYSAISKCCVVHITLALSFSRSHHSVCKPGIHFCQISACLPGFWIASN